MLPQFDRVQLALGAFHIFGSASRVRAGIKRLGVAGLEKDVLQLPSVELAQVQSDAEDLVRRGVDACLLTGDGYPPALAATRSAPAALFLYGNHELLCAPAVGMCGSRNASEQGLKAAYVCGEEVASRGLTIVSGYAKGIDTQTHLAAIASGGNTVIVLAEGINHFREKKILSPVGLPLDRVIVVSQFPPEQRWTVGGAMTRNAVIAGLATALVVIEASDKGGTLNAGLQALDMGRPVIALEFGEDKTPPGNRILFDRGAKSVRTRQDLGRVLEAIRTAKRDEPLQLPLL